MATVRNRIVTQVDVVADRARGTMRDFRTEIAQADGAFGKIKAGGSAALGAIKANAVVAGAAIGGAFVAGASKAINAASNLEESVNAVRVTFGDAADDILAIGETAASSMGLSERAFNQAAVSFAGFADKIGGDTADTIGTLTQRAADFASVMNLDVEEALQIFQSTLAGETEAIRKYGGDVSAAAVEQFALAEGLVTSKNEMTESIKVQARYGLLMQQTAKAAGDFAATNDSLANAQRVLGAEVENLAAELGQSLAPAAAGIVGLMIDLVRVARSLKDAWEDLRDFDLFGIFPSQEELDDHQRAVEEEIGLVDELGDTLADVANTVDMSNQTLAQNRFEVRALEAAQGDLADTAETDLKSAIEATNRAFERQQQESQDLQSELARQKQQYDDLWQAQTNLISTDIAYRNATEASRAALERYNDTLEDSESTTREQEQASRDLESAIANQAAAAVQLAVDQAALNGVTLSAQEQTRLYWEEVERLGQAIGPGNPAVRNLQNLQAQTDAAGAAARRAAAAYRDFNVAVTGVQAGPGGTGLGPGGGVPTFNPPPSRVPPSVLAANPQTRNAAGVNVTVNAGLGTNGQRVGDEIVQAIGDYERRNGPGWRGG